MKRPHDMKRSHDMTNPHHATRSRFLLRASLLVLAAAPLCACAVGPDFLRPDAPVPQSFKEDQGWKPATPAQITSENWWSIYNDAVLDGLEKQVAINNQNVAQAEANYRAARAEVGVQRGQLFPTIGATGSMRETGGGRNGSSTIITGTTTPGTGTTGAGGAGTTGTGTSIASGGGGTRRTYSATLSGSWDIDIWGQVRRQVESSSDTAAADAADLAAVRLLAQSEVAQDYFQLRAAEEQTRLLDAALTDFNASLQIAKNRLNAGIATQADVSTAQTEVDNAEAQRVGVQLTRDKLEHAIAVLVGKPPSELSIAPTEMMAMDVPVIPAGVPSTLLERRPDVAEAERRAASANAQIGVAEAAWFPDVTLSGSYGFTGSKLASLFSASNAAWAFGPSIAETIFNGGARLYQVREARANYDAQVAAYRQTVLTSFQQVEDDLASLRILEDEARVDNTTVTDALTAERIIENQYKSGIVDYTQVVTAQTNRLNAQVAALNVRSQRLTSSVDLIQAVGGGWSNAELPPPASADIVDALSLPPENIGKPAGEKPSSSD
jgi:NodT family efflux transporter outer membrane factor (OMF) lipoprotein